MLIIDNMYQNNVIFKKITYDKSCHIIDAKCINVNNFVYQKALIY